MQTILIDGSFQLHDFAELSGNDLYQIMQLRSAVFVLEQDCAYQDLDGLDQQALHLFKKDVNDKVIAYARIMPPELCHSTHTSIGRVVVSNSSRHLRIGAALMQAAIDTIHKHYPKFPIKISAQSYLSDFYQNLGFINTGLFYLEDQIPHQEMILNK